MKKTKLSNSFFAKKSPQIEARSNLPTPIMRRTNESLNTINFTQNDLLSVIRKLNPKKEHVYDQNSICILQICDKLICKPFLYRVRNLPN